MATAASLFDALLEYVSPGIWTIQSLMYLVSLESALRNLNTAPLNLVANTTEAYFY